MLESELTFDWDSFLHCARAEGDTYLSLVSEFVQSHEDEEVPLKPHGAIWTISEQTEPICSEKELEQLGQFYLPDEVTMVVMGKLRNIPGHREVVLMTCEDRQLYAYDGEELHLMGNITQLRKRGIEYPGSKRFYRGEAFKDVTEEEWEEVRKGESSSPSHDCRWVRMTVETGFSMDSSCSKYSK
ncbi:hypothetical protein LDENG_00168540 [Lucifuga dentata]|nr:hypothetical protein LDENG_00168540 [Lucifuga dentata]